MQYNLNISMELLSFSGCSITWGDELENRLDDRFSKLVSDHYGCRAYNMGVCGVSNDYLVRNTINYLKHAKPDVLVMQFTVTQRIEYYDANKETQKWTPQRLRSTTQRDYYTKIYNDVLGAENLWKNIFLFDTFCKSIGQKYVSVIAEHYENTQRFPERYYQNKKGYWRSMCTDYNPVWMQMDLLKGLKTHPFHYANGINGGHPSPQGHRTIANKIIELIDAI